MKHTIGSVLQFTPATPGDKINITYHGDKSPASYPLLGWAIVVRWNGDPDHVDNGEQETSLEPVALIDGQPCTMHEIRTEAPGTRYEVRP